MSAPVKYVLLPAKQRKVLRFCTFHKFGKCKFGNRCDLIHDTRIQIPCPYVECKFGKSCWYSHGAGPLEEKVETHNGKNSTKHVQNSVSYEIMMGKVETAIGILQQDYNKIYKEICLSNATNSKNRFTLYKNWSNYKTKKSVQYPKRLQRKMSLTKPERLRSPTLAHMKYIERLHWQT